MSSRQVSFESMTDESRYCRGSLIHITNYCECAGNLCCSCGIQCQVLELYISSFDRTIPIRAFPVIH